MTTNLNDGDKNIFIEKEKQEMKIVELKKEHDHVDYSKHQLLDKLPMKTKAYIYQINNSWSCNKGHTEIPKRKDPNL